MSENMEKTAIRFDHELKSEIQNMMSEATATSMADFVRQATEFYIAYLRQKKSIDFLAPLLAQTIKNEIESVEKNISSILFKLSVEQAIINNIVACYNACCRCTSLLRHSKAYMRFHCRFSDAYVQKKYHLFPQNPLRFPTT